MSETTEKVSKASVNYRPAPMGSKSRCGTCSMFRPDGTCTLVEGRINPMDVCDRYEPKTQGPTW